MLNNVWVNFTKLKPIAEMYNCLSLVAQIMMQLARMVEST
jgi:hypothetical protein